MYKSIILFSLLLLVSCKLKKPAASDSGTPSQSCKTIATVIDMSNLDGCQYLLQVENGEKWLPLEISDPNFKFHNGQKVKFDYKEVEDYMSICMAENKGVNITCIKEVAKSPSLPLACTEVPNLLKTDWIQKVIRDKNIRQITQYENESEFVYYFKSYAKGYLYDCKGVLICDLDENTPSDCTKKLSSLKNEYIIWVLNN